ncbi:MAG: sensor histidine kinase [Chitinophagaceae bacterium]
MLKGIMIAILFLPLVVLQAQRFYNRDSLLQVLSKEKEDTNKVTTLLRIAKYYEANNQDSAIYYLEKAKSLSRSLQFNKGLFTYYEQLGIVYFTKGDYGKAIELNNNALKLARQLKDSGLVIVILNHIGIVHGLQQHFSEQLDYALQVTNTLEVIGDSSRLSGAYQNLANCYNALRQFRKAVDYTSYAILLHTVYHKRSDYINRAYASLAQAYDGLLMVDSASYFYQKAISESVRVGDKYAEASIYGYVSTLYANTGKYNDMRQMAEKSLAVSRTLQSREMEATALYSVGYADFLNHDNLSARENIMKALGIALADTFRIVLTNCYNILSGIAARDGDYATYVMAKNKTDSIYEVILNAEVVKSGADLEKKYETEKKDNQLKLQHAQLQQKNIFNYLLTGGILTIVLISVLTYRNYYQKQRLQQQRISELEKDKLLVAVDSMLKGQEDERSRLAKDLHDGLGGLLSGVKFSLIHMKDNLIITPDNMTVFERSLDMIDTAIRELRRVAHNMMPEMLVKFGLDEALKEYCNSINTTKLVTVKYQSLGMETRLESSVEIIIYRIVQELLNNIIKHAAATAAFVQLIREGHRLNVVVEDNGKGFDTALPVTTLGAGLANVRSRVDYLKGQLAIHAEPGKGTLVNIEFNL